ncbi:hypothetical protein XANCAGTX0491_005899 [Xanthoria calcicola]
MASKPVSPAQRKKILRVIVISLLLDLISFTFILPLFPRLLEFYRDHEAADASPHSLLNRILLGLNAYKHSFSRPISDRYDVVLLGGALGSLFSMLQAIASPFIGSLSDKYGRRTALLWSMAGNIASVALWLAATDFRTFLASRFVGGLSESNVQLATAMAADVSDENQRGATMALVGACFSVAFTFGPALGAALASVETVAANPFATAAGVSLLLILVETLYLYLYLPETLPSSRPSEPGSGSVEKSKVLGKSTTRTNSYFLLNSTHFIFILFFSGMEFSLPFMTYDLFAYTSSQTGRLLGFMGLLASILQGGVTRRVHPLRAVQVGVVACVASLFLLGRITTEAGLWAAASLLAITTSTVVSGLNTLSSFEAAEAERGGKLGNHRSWGKSYAGSNIRPLNTWSIGSSHVGFSSITNHLTGQAGRALGPLLFCSLYWWAGRQVAYSIGAAGMLGVSGLVFGALKAPL